MRRLKIAWFWAVAFSVLVWNILKGNTWHMIYVDFHLGDYPDGRPIRKQLIAKRRVGGFDIYWQDLSVYDKSKT
jgi:hypothetical protein